MCASISRQFEFVQQQWINYGLDANAGNYKDAYEDLRKIALDPKVDPLKVSVDLTTGISCLVQLGRVDEIDEFREGVIDAHKTNWRLLDTAAATLSNPHESNGYIVAGKFYRGHKRGGTGRGVNTIERDRTRKVRGQRDGNRGGR